MAVVGGLDELRRHPDAARTAIGSLPAHAPLEHESRAQLGADLLQRLRCGAVLLRTGPADHPESRQAGQPTRDLLGESVGEVLIGRRAQILDGRTTSTRSAVSVDGAATLGPSRDASRAAANPKASRPTSPRAITAGLTRRARGPIASACGGDGKGRSAVAALSASANSSSSRTDRRGIGRVLAAARLRAAGECRAASRESTAVARSACVRGWHGRWVR
jgi:hypothetical protein